MDWTRLLTSYEMSYCKNSYVYSALSNIEARYFAWTGEKSELSVRQAFECERFGNCQDGGVPHNVFTALQNTGGVSYVTEYPTFEDRDNITKYDCATKNHPVKIQITGYIRFKVKNENDLIPLLSIYGPVSTTICVSDSLKNYQEGVYDSDDCGTNATNHAVLVAGYGYDTTLKLPFWRILTAWGEDWGEDGYFRLRRGNHTCNFAREYIATAIVQPVQPNNIRSVRNNIARTAAVTTNYKLQNFAATSVYPYQIS
ncbi:cathepsin L1-like [Hyposmocoma kahamanoa]|uniref:cathepsin L1-like n=1 Tax=Hyposmocoma kahamanoa TaxID=1477025 RepID=UPI000E6D8DF4|nr:cathepsin L1-like [Hyposmocoma kahamanoa]